jgi:hypothetical protein
MCHGCKKKIREGKEIFYRGPEWPRYCFECGRKKEAQLEMPEPEPGFNLRTPEVADDFGAAMARLEAAIKKSWVAAWEFDAVNQIPCVLEAKKWVA